MSAQFLTPVGLGLLCLVTGWIAVLAPARTALAARQERLAAVRAAVTRARAAAATRPQVERQLRALETAVEEAATMIPNEPDQDALFRAVFELAAAFHLRLTRFAPKPPVTRPNYTEWPIDLALEGTSSDVRRFFGRLAGLPQLMTLDEVEIKALDEPVPGRSIAARFTVTAIGGATDVPAGRAPSLRVEIHVESDSDAGEERDPFVRVMPATKPAGTAPRHAATLAGQRAADVSVTAIVRAGAISRAVLTASEGRSFVARDGDRLRDAVVSSIDAAGVLFAVTSSSSGGDGERREIRRVLRRAVGKENR